MRLNDFVLAADWIKDADAILVTASNGLSISEGYHIFANDENFRKYFGTFARKYKVDCLICGVFTPMSAEDHEAYMQTVHQYLIDDYNGSSVMRDLLDIVSKKPYFILTSNGDKHFQMNGFDENRIYEIEGNFDGMQEKSPEWAEQRERFSGFIMEHKEKSMVVLELGIGSCNRLIKAPTMDLIDCNKSWKFITMNMPNEINVIESIRDRTIALTGDIGSNLKEIHRSN